MDRRLIERIDLRLLAKARRVGHEPCEQCWRAVRYGELVESKIRAIEWATCGNQFMRVVADRAPAGASRGRPGGRSRHGGYDQSEGGS